MSEKKNVLVVDDEAGICEVLKDFFEDEGYAVGVARNGREALELMRAQLIKPSLVILDLLMPVLDGNAVYTEMMADPALREVRVLVTTSDPSRAPSGVQVLRKPVSLQLLLDAVRSA